MHHPSTTQPSSRFCCPLTLGFAGVLILVFILELIFGTDAFTLTRDTLFTSRIILAFLAHASLTHLAFNLLGILFFGMLLERDTTLLAFSSFLLLSGILVNLTLPFTPYTAVIGASGIVYALGAAFAIRHPLTPVLALGIPVPGFLALLLWAIQQVILEGTGQTAYALHLAGIGIGLLFGRVLPPRETSEGNTSPPQTSDDADLEALIDAYEEAYLLRT